MKQWIANYKPIVFATTLLSLAIAVSIWSGLRTKEKPANPNQAWYFDTESAKLFPGPAFSMRPVPAPSGADGVLAAVYACGACNEANAHTVLYVTKSADPKAKHGESPKLVAAAQLPLRWVPADSPAGNAVTARPFRAMREKCGGQLQECRPQ